MCLLVLMQLGATDVSAVHTVRMGLFLADPLVIKTADGKFDGSIVRVIEQIASQEGWNLECVQCDLPKCLKMLEAGTLDLMGPIAINDERREQFDYINETFFMDWGQIYAPYGQEITSILDLEGKRVAVLKNTAQYPAFKKLLDSFGINIEPIFVQNYMDVFEYAVKGKADVLMVNRIFGEKHIGKYDIHKTPIIFTPMDIRYATPKNWHKDIRDTIDRHLAEMKRDNDSVYHREISRMIHGGKNIFQMPEWVRVTALAGGGTILFFVFMSLVLRHQVNLRTEDIRKENAERRQAERALYESRESFKALVEFTAAIHWELELPEKRFTYVSPQAKAILGYPAESWTDMNFWASIIDPDDRDRAVSYCMGEVQKCKDHALEYRAIASDGHTVWLRDIVKVIAGEKGPEKLIGIMLDITDQKLSEARLESSLKEKEVLLREVHHRVKNNMAVINAMSNLQANYMTDKEAIRALRDNQGRIRSMALVHEQLYESENFTDISVERYVRKLASNFLAAYTMAKRDIIEFDVKEFSLNLDSLIPCGLIINELLTNAIKYAFDDFDAARIRITFYKNNDGDVILSISDNGKGLPADLDIMTSKTLGFRLVRTLCDQIDATLSVESREGTTVSLTFREAEPRNRNVMAKVSTANSHT